MSTRFAPPALPARGMFTVSNPKPALVQQMMAALRAAPKGGFVSLRGHPVFITEVAVDTRANTMTVHYHRVGAKPRTTRARELGELRRGLMNGSALSTQH